MRAGWPSSAMPTAGSTRRVAGVADPNCREPWQVLALRGLEAGCRRRRAVRVPVAARRNACNVSRADERRQAAKRAEAPVEHQDGAVAPCAQTARKDGQHGRLLSLGDATLLVR